MNNTNPTSQEKALKVLESERVAVFVVAFNAEAHIGRTLSRIPPWVAERLAEVYIIDDCSGDATVASAHKVQWPTQFAPLRIYKTPANQGYGGNQKIGFSYALERGFDIVVLLHGDGQYAPEALPDILAPYADGADAVFGSRFLTPGAARRGGMPLYKVVGNRILTRLQNGIAGANLSEWHSGYRSYRTRLLRQVPFGCNSDGFEFDAEIIIQALANHRSIVEVPIPTFYGDEICHVNGLQYACRCIQRVTQYRLMQCGLFFDPKYDLERWEDDSYRYKRKVAPTTVHHFVRSLSLAAGTRILDVGGGDGRAVAADFIGVGCFVTCIDQVVPACSQASEHVSVDLDAPWETQVSKSQYDVGLALDVIEHLKRPEAGVESIRRKLKTGGMLYASTANVAFLPLRLMLLMGWFNYGRKGILDRTHTRLFTVRSFKRLLRQGGFQVLECYGFGPPIRDLLGGGSTWLKGLDWLLFKLAQWCPPIFGYQIMIVARKVADLRTLTDETTRFVAHVTPGTTSEKKDLSGASRQTEPCEFTPV